MPAGVPEEHSPVDLSLFDQVQEPCERLSGVDRVEQDPLLSHEVVDRGVALSAGNAVPWAVVAEPNVEVLKSVSGLTIRKNKF